LDFSKNRSELLGKVLKCDSGKRWRRCVGRIILKMKTYHTQSQGRERHPAYNRTKKKIDDWIGLIWRINCLLKLVVEGKIKRKRRRGRNKAATR
jgi:hypothetical protein